MLHTEKTNTQAHIPSNMYRYNKLQNDLIWIVKSVRNIHLPPYNIRNFQLHKPVHNALELAEF